jgi:hypothetical protein
MKLPKKPPATAKSQEIGEMLLRAGETLHGKNLRTASWLEIAERFTRPGRHQSILWERLVGASTREDALRVLRIARKISQTKAKSSKTRRHPARRELTHQRLSDSLYEAEGDEYWDCLDPRDYDDWNDRWEPDSDDWDLGWDEDGSNECRLIYEMRRVEYELRARFLLRYQTDGVDRNSLLQPSPPIVSPVEVRLADHLRAMLAAASRRLNDPELDKWIIPAVGDQRNFEIVRAYAEGHEKPKPFFPPQLTSLLCFFAPFWIRQPLAWNGKGCLFDHLFVRESVPACLYSAWGRGGLAISI